MSKTEVKKSSQRGISGQNAAESAPFRKGGRPCNYSVKLGNPRSKYGNGSKMVNAASYGVMLGGTITSGMDIRASAAMARCTAPSLV